MTAILVCYQRSSSRGNHTVLLNTHVLGCTAGEVVGEALVSATISVKFLSKCAMSEGDIVSVESVLVGSVLPVGGSGFIL